MGTAGTLNKVNEWYNINKAWSVAEMKEMGFYTFDQNMWMCK